MKMKNRIAYFVVAVAVLTSLDAFGHALSIFVHEEGGAVKGSVYFTGGTPAKNAVVKITDVLGNAVSEVTTDADGNFVYNAENPRGTLMFVVSTPDGHRAESKLQGTDLATVKGPDTGDAASPPIVPMTVERQLGAIQEAIDRLENRLWLRDVIGGIGYIFGLAGLWALWKSRNPGARH